MSLLHIIHYNWRLLFVFKPLRGKKKQILPCETCHCDCWLHSGDSSQPSEYKLSEALDKVGYSMGPQCTSCLASALPGCTAFRAENKSTCSEY